MSARPICNLPDMERLRHTPVECRCGRTVCHEGQHECACGGRWGGRLGADGSRTPEIGPADAQPRESASGGKWFTRQQEFAAADYLESRLAAADMPAGAGWCLDLTRRMIRALNGREPDA